MHAAIELLVKNNPGLKITEDENNVIIKNPWNDDSVNFIIPKNEELSLLEDIHFVSEFVAIFHKDKIEFIYGPLPEDDIDIEKKFKINYKNKSFSCEFSTVSKTFELLAKHFREAKTESTTYYRNLRYFRDYYHRAYIFKEAYKYTKPINFFITGSYQEIEDKIQFAKIVNFYMTYFQRSSPQIAIMKKNPTTEEIKLKEPCFTLFNKFPLEINAHSIDPVLLDIFLIARDSSNIRLKFIFYYQILEYASYYFMNSKIKTRLNNILKDPALIDNSNFAARQIIEEMKDNFSLRDDFSRLEQTVLEYCKINDVQNELSCNSNFFSEDHQFDGGFVIEKILKESSAIDFITDSDLQKILRNIEKIRNVLVHLRESRENKVILPTLKNDELIKPYLYLLFRIAEKVAIQFEV